jgi:hypothetical protein
MKARNLGYEADVFATMLHLSGARAFDWAKQYDALACGEIFRFWMADGACWLAFPLGPASSAQQLEFLSVAHRYIWRISPDGKWDCLRANQAIVPLEALYAGFASMGGLLMGQRIPGAPAVHAANGHDWPLDCHTCLVTALAVCLRDINKIWLQNLGVATMTPGKWGQINDCLLLRTIATAETVFPRFFARLDHDILSCLLSHCEAPGHAAYAELWDLADRMNIAREELLATVADITDEVACATNRNVGSVPEILAGWTDTIADHAPLVLGLGYLACRPTAQDIASLPPAVLQEIGRIRFGRGPGRCFALLIRHVEAAHNYMLVELQKPSGKAGGIPKLLRYSMLDHPPAANTDVFLLAQLLRRLAER